MLSHYLQAKLLLFYNKFSTMNTIVFIVASCCSLALAGDYYYDELSSAREVAMTSATTPPPADPTVPSNGIAWPTAMLSTFIGVGATIAVQRCNQSGQPSPTSPPASGAAPTAPESPTSPAGADVSGGPEPPQIASMRDMAIQGPTTRILSDLRFQPLAAEFPFVMIGETHLRERTASTATQHQVIQTRSTYKHKNAQPRYADLPVSVPLDICYVD